MGNTFLDVAVILLSFYVMAKVVDDYFLVSLDNISNWLKLTPSVAGATLMAVGTSAPELSTSLFALFLPNANPATGLGTVVGSAIFQILVVIGFASLIKTAYLDWKPVIRDGVFYAITIVLLITFVADDRLTLSESSILVGTYVVYLILLIVWSRFVDESSQPDPIELIDKERKSLKFDGLNNEVAKAKKLIKKINKINPLSKIASLIPDCSEDKRFTGPIFIFSLAIIAASSYYLVISAESLALALNVPPAIIALTILAGGSSVPELISSAVVSKQGRGDMAISNAIGSNVFDILMSLGLPLFLYNLTSGDISDVGGPNIKSSIILLFATLISVLLLLIAQKFKIGKRFGVILILLYVAYVVAAYAGLL